MQYIFWIELVIAISAILCAFASMGTLLYLGKHHVKELDKLIYGHELPNDSFFFLMLRVPNYALAFIWPFYAKRAGLLAIHDKFDRSFKRPFVLHMLLLISGIVLLIILGNLQKYYP